VIRRQPILISVVIKIVGTYTPAGSIGTISSLPLVI